MVDENYLEVPLDFDYCRSPKQCGCWYNDTNIGSADKIVGGFESTPHSWPWVVSIRKRTSDIPLGLPICGNSLNISYILFILLKSIGGTLINEQYILTAAHCSYWNIILECFDLFDNLFQASMTALSTKRNQLTSIYLLLDHITQQIHMFIQVKILNI